MFTLCRYFLTLRSIVSAFRGDFTPRDVAAKIDDMRGNIRAYEMAKDNQNVGAIRRLIEDSIHYGLSIDGRSIEHVGRWGYRL